MQNQYTSAAHILDNTLGEISKVLNHTEISEDMANDLLDVKGRIFKIRNDMLELAKQPLLDGPDTLPPISKPENTLIDVDVTFIEDD